METDHTPIEARGAALTDAQVASLLKGDTETLVPSVASDPTHELVQCAEAVLEELPLGLSVECYLRALVIELNRRHIPCDENVSYTVHYRDQPVGVLVCELIAFENILVDVRVSDVITYNDRAQLAGFLRVSRKDAAVILNFRHRPIEWERIVLAEEPVVRTT